MILLFVKPAGHSDCCKCTEEELKSYQSKVNSLESAVSACNEEIKLLKHQILTAETTFSEEVGKRDTYISHLGSELEHKAQVIARLTKQLHQMKIEFTRVSEASAVMQSLASSTTADYNTSCSQRTGTEHPEVVVAKGRIRRRVRRATASALPHDPVTHHQNSSESREKTLTRRSLPTPVSYSHTPPPPPPSVSPRPPSTSPPQRLLHRASRVTHKRPRPANEASLLQPSQNTAPVPRSTTSLHMLDPVQLQKQAPDVTDILKHEDNSASNVCIITKSSPPVLPPIPTNSNFVVHQTTETTSSIRDPETRQHLAFPLHHSRHGHVILARSQGLRSAPSSVHKVLAGRAVGDLKEGQWNQMASSRKEEVEEGGERNTTEGMLLVKEETHHEGNQAWQELHQSGSD